jgi:hypothetical protein
MIDMSGIYAYWKRILGSCRSTTELRPRAFVKHRNHYSFSSASARPPEQKLEQNGPCGSFVGQISHKIHYIVRRLFSRSKITGARHWGSPGTNNSPPAGRPPRVRVRISLGGQEMSK